MRPGSSPIRRSTCRYRTPDYKTIPDLPFNTFQLTLPEGKYSALAANGNLCKSKLVMPTAFTAQHGLAIHESTKISVSGCAKKAVNKKRSSAKKSQKQAKR